MGGASHRRGGWRTGAFRLRALLFDCDLFFVLLSIDCVCYVYCDWLIAILETNQSSGKSSVLESVVGRDFLPRGSGNLHLQRYLICISFPSNVISFLHK